MRRSMARAGRLVILTTIIGIGVGPPLTGLRAEELIFDHRPQTGTSLRRVKIRRISTS